VGIATVNVEGNGMDIGHPLGAAGARITCKAEALSGR
jgi:acetyl-CoA acetyltransferase